MLSQTLFKYRSLSNLDFILDAILNKRLYAALYKDLNDPMEGKFKYKMTLSASAADRRFVELLIREQDSVRICSLSETAANTLLWSYYAAGHSGMVLGVKVNDRGAEVVKVNYTNDLEFRPFDGSAAGTEARKVLLNKSPQWAHEREVRVLTRTDYVHIKLQSIYLGCKISRFHEELVRRLLKSVAPTLEVRKLDESELDNFDLFRSS
jgi:hypothetical protein